MTRSLLPRYRARPLATAVFRFTDYSIYRTVLRNELETETWRTQLQRRLPAAPAPYRAMLSMLSRVSSNAHMVVRWWPDCRKLTFNVVKDGGQLGPGAASMCRLHFGSWAWTTHIDADGTGCVLELRWRQTWLMFGPRRISLCRPGFFPAMRDLMQLHLTLRRSPP